MKIVPNFPFFLNIIWSKKCIFLHLKILSRVKLLICVNVSNIGLRTKLHLLISGRPLCKPGLHNQALHAKTTRFYESTRSACLGEEKKKLKSQLPHQQPNQRDILPPTSMGGERSRGRKGGGGGNNLPWEKSFFGRKCEEIKTHSWVKKTEIHEETAKM